MIDIREHTILIVGVTLAVLLISTVMVPVLDAVTTGETRHENAYEYEATRYDSRNMDVHGLLSITMVSDLVQDSVWPPGSLHPEYFSDSRDPGNTKVWEERYLPEEVPPIVAYWGSGAVVNYGDSLGYVGFDYPEGLGFTLLRDVNFEYVGPTDPYNETKLTIVIYGTEVGSSGTRVQLPSAEMVIFPHRGGELAICQPSDGTIYADGSAPIVSFGSSGTVAALSFAIAGTVHSGEIYAELDGIRGAWFDTESGDQHSPHSLTVADSESMSTTAQMRMVTDTVLAIQSVESTVNGIQLEPWVITEKEVTVTSEGGPVASLVGVIPLMMLVAVMVPVTDAIRPREERRRKRVDDEDER